MFGLVLPNDDLYLSIANRIQCLFMWPQVCALACDRFSFVSLSSVEGACWIPTSGVLAQNVGLCLKQFDGRASFVRIVCCVFFLCVAFKYLMKSQCGECVAQSVNNCVFSNENVDDSARFLCSISNEVVFYAICVFFFSVGILCGFSWISRNVVYALSRERERDTIFQNTWRALRWIFHGVVPNLPHAVMMITECVWWVRVLY